jgi:hypothetical protein
LALVDLLAGDVVQRTTVCTPGEATITDLVLENSEAGPTAYVSLWTYRANQQRTDDTLPNGWVKTLDPLTGATTRSIALSEAPARLFLSSTNSPSVSRLHVQVQPPANDWSTVDDAFLLAQPRRMIGLNRVTLDVEIEYLVPTSFVPLAVSPEGDQVYGTDNCYRLVEVDLALGTTRNLASLPSLIGGLAITDDRVYAADARRDEVWAYSRRDGRRVQTIRVGQNPTSVTLARPWG